MSFIEVDAAEVLVGNGGRTAPIVYVVDSPEHPFDVRSLTCDRVTTLATIPICNWNDALTPWPAEALYRGEADFGGKAADTLAELVGEVIPAIERREGLVPTCRAICGYSLGGLFALYALTHNDVFAACACLSGSVWYEGWVEHVRDLDLDLRGRFAYLSVGTKEKRAARPILKTVQDRMEMCAEILRAYGAQIEYRTGPGNHLQHIPERFAAGLAALDVFLGSQLP